MKARVPRPIRRALRARRAGPPAPFVVGAARSGTTMLRLMLDSHPELAIGPESGFALDAVEASRRGDGDRERARLAAAAITGHRRFPDFGLDPAQLRTAIEALEPFSPADAVRIFYRAYADRHRKPRWGDKTPRPTVP